MTTPPGDAPAPRPDPPTDTPAPAPGAGGAGVDEVGAGEGRRRYVERVRAGMRDDILDAVEQLVRDRGWAATRMADVAARAGVSRQTIYQLYGSREALAQAYVLREADQFLRTVEDAVRDRSDDPLAAVEAGVDAFLTGAADNVMVKSILCGEGRDDLLPLVTTQSLPVIDVARQRLTAVIDELWPDFDPDDVRIFGESIIRLAISHVTTGNTEPEAAVRDICRLVRPFILEALARATDR